MSANRTRKELVWLLLENMQTCVYYNPRTDTETHTHVSVNAALYFKL